MTDPALLEIDNAERVFGGGRTLFGKNPAGGACGCRAYRSTCAGAKRLAWSGESGCGKSTLARLIVGLDTPTGGAITFDGVDLVAEARRDPQKLARRVQYVFQDPVASLNPRKTIRTILEAPAQTSARTGPRGRAKSACES